MISGNFGPTLNSDLYSSGSDELPSIHLRSSRMWGLFLVGMATTMLCAPFIRTIFMMTDEGVLLHAAERMLRGKIIYADFFEFHPVGSFVITAGWFGFAGISVWSARSLAILTIIGIACFTYLVCHQASRNVWLSGILTIGWVVMSQGLWTQLNHHWLTTLFSMMAMWAALNNFGGGQRRLRWGFIAGTAAGLAAMTTPHRGILAIMAGLIAFASARRHWLVLIAYCAATTLVPISLTAYLAWHHALAAAFEDAVGFVITRYAPIEIVPFGTFVDRQNFLFLYLYPVVALMTVLVCVRGLRSCLKDGPFRSYVAFATCAFVGSFPRADIIHVFFAAPLVFPLLAFCMTRLALRWHPAARYAAVGVLIGLCTPSALAFSSLAQEAIYGKVVSTPRGRVAFFNQPGAPEILFRLSALSPSDGYFFYPYMPMMPFLSGREHISRYDIFVPGYTLPSQYREACTSVMQHAAWLVIDRKLTDVRNLKEMYPAMNDTKPTETVQFEKALSNNFSLIASEGRFELRRRREGINDADCASITE